MTIRTGSRRSNDRTRVCSKIRTPASSAARRRPRASAAGCTVAAESSITPARWKAEPERRAISSGSSLPERPDAELFAEGDDALPGAHLRGGGGRPEPPGLAEVRVDPARLAERPDLVDRGLRPARDPHRVGLAAQPRERGELGPPGEDEPAVSARRAAAADVLLEHHDVARGLEPLHAEGRPQAHVSAAEDGDVGARVALQRRARPARRPRPPGARTSGASDGSLRPVPVVHVREDEPAAVGALRQGERELSDVGSPLAIREAAEDVAGLPVRRVRERAQERAVPRSPCTASRWPRGPAPAAGCWTSRSRPRRRAARAPRHRGRARPSRSRSARAQAPAAAGWTAAAPEPGSARRRPAHPEQGESAAASAASRIARVTSRSSGAGRRAPRSPRAPSCPRRRAA